MLQGSKAEQRKWWLYNRFRYIDSKYNAGDALTDVIQIRGYAKADVTVTPYAAIYASVKYGSYLTQKRARRNEPITLECPLDNVNDTEIYIYSASQLAAVGNLSGLMPGFADLSKATKLQSLKLGDASGSYSNGNLTSLTLGNNGLLRSLDVRNCPNLTQTVDASGCKNIEEVYLEGTAITGVNLPNGGILKTLHLPATVTNLTIRNQTALRDLTIPSYENISTLRLENVGAAVNGRAILEGIPANSRVRMVGFSWEAASVEEIFALYDLLDTMRGLDENGNNMEQAQMGGEIHIDALTGAELAQMLGRYPNIDVTYDHITSYLYYYNYDGSQLLYTESVYDGGDGAYSGKPARSSTAQYTYAFAGWSLKPNGNASADAQKKVGADRKIYAAYTATIRKYTVYFYNGSTLLQTVQNVVYGGSARYTGETPVKTGVEDPENYVFSGWSPSPNNIQGNTSCYASYGYIGLEETITDTWEEIFAAEADGSYKERYNIGDTKIIDLGPEGNVCMQIIGFDVDDLADGSGKAPISWLSEQLLATSHRMNPSLGYIYDFRDAKGWPEGTGSISSSTGTHQWNARNSYTDNVHAVGKMVITAAEDGEIKVEARLSTTWTSDKLTCIVDGEVLCEGYSSSTYVTKTVGVTEGQTITVDVDYLNTNTSSQNYGQIRITGKCSYVRTAEDSKERYVRAYTDGTGAIGGWERSDMRAYFNETILPLIPPEVRTHIVEVSKSHPAYRNSTSSAGSTQSFTQTTQDKVWLPSYSEMYNGAYKTLFPDNASRIKKNASSVGAVPLGFCT